MDIEAFLERFDGVHQSGEGWVAKCPIHGDRKASLSIGRNGDKILLNCHAGCPNETILDSLSLKLSDLFETPLEPQPTNGHSASSSLNIVAEYDYKDENGALLYQVVRLHPKDFRQRRPDGQGGWSWNIAGVRRVPYMLSDLLNYPKEPVCIVEGEKDVHRLRMHDFLATTCSGGANAKWLEAWTPWFAGRTIYLIPDRDNPGYAFIHKIASVLKDVCTLCVVELYGYKDISEWFDKRHTKEEFVKLTDEAKPWTPQLKFVNEHQYPPVDTHHGFIGEIVAAMEPCTEADPIGLYVELMVMFGACIGRAPHHRVGGSHHRGNLFTGLIGDTADGRKGETHATVLDFFRGISPTTKEFVDGNITPGLSTGEGLVHNVRDPVSNVGEDGRVKVVDKGVKDKRRYFFEPEMSGSMFTVMRRDGYNLSSIIRQAWDGETLAVVTKTNAERATDPYICILGHTTPQEFVRVIRPEDISNGLLNRFFFIWVRRSKKLPRPPEMDAMVLANLRKKADDALDAARKIGKVELAPEAERLWDEIYDTVTDQIRVHIWAPALSRGLGHIKRMALILTVLDGRSLIGVEDLTMAKSIWDYSVKTLEVVAGGADDAGFKPGALKLMAFLEQEERMMSVSEIAAAMKWSGSQVTAAKGDLLRARRIHEYREQSGGRPRLMIGLY